MSRISPPLSSAVFSPAVASSSSFRVATKSAEVSSCALRSRRSFSLSGLHDVGGGCWRWRLTSLARIRHLSSRSLCLHHSGGALNKFDAVGFAGRSRNVANAFDSLEMNLFDDPTGGLTAGPAEELSTTEIEHQVRLNVSSYSRSIFYLLYTPFVDVISVLLERGLAPDVAHPGEMMCRWFTDGALTLQNPASVEEGMGAENWRQLCEGLDAFYEEVEPVMPLTAAVRKHGLPEDLLVPFLRQLSMDLLVPLRKRAVLEILPGLILGLANGRAPTALGFPTDSQRARAIMVADLFLGVGQETGNTDLAYLGIQLLRANDIPVPFPKQKQLTNVFSAATRIHTDWQMRVSGQLVEVMPKWMEYYKKVHLDNLRAIKGLSEADSTSAVKQEDDDGEGIDVLKEKRVIHAIGDGVNAAGKQTDKESNSDGVHGYFSSHRTENLLRLSALESQVLTAVRRRMVAWNDDSNKLYYRFRRRRSATEEPKVEETDVPKEPTEEEEEEDARRVDAAEDVVLMEDGRRRRRAKTHTQADEEDPKVNPKGRRSRRKRTIAAPVDDDSGSTFTLTV
ncbi:hypothetical protein C3747_90g165 [Trypanosoma cruzi]|uniref:Uncharacterized protein n=3 Tax=Trypanosoma cruzi TaxID=5693 RepID=Q4CSM9_TRYCC|nr:hypothetical protein, conserved [Trypanosoma cruzi]EAN83281.1 hypothetical protein, conserved [Trypanosoma cruzi]PWV08398.1 hypothetical protein C3747_90g165 [Trypanosoma cruzi]|eukprot:XP_805132.1 hypothetical protein [Trypanosoma cruzi strain CL Brener]